MRLDAYGAGRVRLPRRPVPGVLVAKNRHATYHRGVCGLLPVMLQLMTSSDDDLLIDELRRVFAAIDPVPEPVQVAARAAIDWRNIDAEPAALVSDSIVDESPPDARGASEPRMLTFEAPDLTIELAGELRLVDTAWL